MKRKFWTVALSLVAVLCLAFALTACGKKDEEYGHEFSTGVASVEGHNVYLTIMTNAKAGTITVSSVNTVVTGDDTDKYKLGTECTINLGTR